MTDPELPATPDAPEAPEAPEGIDVVDRWRYAWADRRRPHLHPVTTPAGHVLTRNAPDDHPWHHALWFTIKFVNDENFWEEYGEYGVLRHDGPPAVVEEADGATALRGTVSWVRPDRTTVALVEDRTLRHRPVADDAYVIELDTTLVPATDVRLDRTEFTTWGGYGGFTLRGPGDWHDTALLLDDGTTHDRLEGVPSRWCDLTGTIGAGGAEAVAGLALFDHPGNRRHPVPFYASTRNETYGDEGWSNFANAAFLWDDSMDVGEGEALRFRHAALVHDGAWSPAQIEAEWSAWVGRTAG